MHYSDEGNPCQSPGRMKNSSYYMAPGRGSNSQPPAHRSVNMIKVSYALTTMELNRALAHNRALGINMYPRIRP